jgi:hypothetical protein
MVESSGTASARSGDAKIKGNRCASPVAISRLHLRTVGEHHAEDDAGGVILCELLENGSPAVVAEREAVLNGRETLVPSMVPGDCLWKQTAGASCLLVATTHLKTPAMSSGRWIWPSTRADPFPTRHAFGPMPGQRQ